MPITNQTLVNSYTGNGATTSFTYGFKIFANTDLKVTVNGTLYVLTTDYTVTGVGADGGGSVVFGIAPANGAVVTIYRDIPFDRSTDYVENGDLKAQTLDNDMDRGVMLTQQLRRDLRRAIKLPIEETDDKGMLDTVSTRANKVVAFDSGGNPVVKSAADISSVFTTVDATLILASGNLRVAVPILEAVAGGTVDALTATVNATLTLTNNLRVILETVGANATTTPTFALNALGAKTIVKGSGIALVAGDIPGANFKADLVFDLSFDKWVLTNPYNSDMTATAQATVQGGAMLYAEDTGVANAYVATLSPAISALTTGMEVRVKIANANTISNPTLNLNGMGAKTIIRADGGGLNTVAGGSAAPDLPANYHAIFRYNGTNMVLINPHMMPDGAITPAKLSIMGAYAVGNYILCLAPTNRTTNAVTFTKIKEMKTTGLSGTLRITYDLMSTGIATSGGAQIYRNGVAVGISRGSVTANVYTTYSEDVAGWNNGDLLQIYGITDGAATCHVKNVSISCSSPLVGGELNGY